MKKLLISLAVLFSLSLAMSSIARADFDDEDDEEQVEVKDLEQEKRQKALLESVSRRPQVLQKYYLKLYSEGNRNAVLNNMILGKEAFKKGFFDDSAKAFDYVLGNLESFYSDTEAAKNARSLWYEESVKDFKGEPYERVMAYYYRGLIYLIEADYGNARASFSAGILQDAFAEDQQNQADFALMYFLAGWSAQKMGSHALAEDDFKRLKKIRPDFKIPSRKENMLLIAETGKSPRKLADGIGHEILVYRRGKRFKEKSAIYTFGKNKSFYPMEDIYWQASTRGGRGIDQIINGKIEFRKTNEAMGTALTDVSVNAQVYGHLAPDSGAANIGAAVSLIGGIQLFMAANARSAVDTRYWNNLPDTVHVATEKSKKALKDLMINFKAKDGQFLADKSKQAVIHTDSKGNTLVWVSSH